MANWITDTEQGAGHLLARVMANRLWQHHFGAASSAHPTTSASKASADAPELLDYLATELIQSGWKLRTCTSSLC
jgi:hypothetical protein